MVREMGRQLFEKAVGYCCEKAGVGAETVRQWLEGGDPWTHSTFRYALARGLGAYLGRNFRVTGAYLYGSTMYDQAGMNSDVDMIVCVPLPNGESGGNTNGHSKLLRFIEDIDREVLDRYKALIKDGVERRFLIDAHIVDEGAIVSRRGYGAIVSSLDAKPVRVWPPY